MKLPKALGALSFAHLLGISAAKAEDDEMKQRADESDEDYAKRMEDEDKKDDEDAKKAKKAEEDKEKEKSKKANESDDDDDKEKAARTAERARCAAIFSCDAAGARPDVAAHLAFSTDMASAEAIAMLTSVTAGAPARTRSLASRMAEVPIPNVGTEAGAAPAASSPQGVAARIIAAGKKARGES